MSFIKKFSYNSPVILTFGLISFIVLVAGILTEGVSTAFLFTSYKGSYTDPLTYVRLVSHIFGHANAEHFFNNMILILLMGPILEEKYGSARIFFMMLFTAVITGAINILFFDVALLGASGVAFMFIILGSFVNLQKGRIPITFLLVIAIFLGKEIYNGIFLIDNISNVSHIAGGVCGALFGYFLNKIPRRPKKEKAIEETAADIKPLDMEAPLAIDSAGTSAEAADETPAASTTSEE